MTRFFVKFLLSVMIGISAAVSLTAKAGTELKQTLREARVLAHETAQVALKTVGDLFSDTAVTVDVSAQGNANSSANAQQTLKLTGTGNLNLDLAPALDLDGSLSNKTSTKTNAKTNDTGLSSQDTIKSTLDLYLNLGQ